MEGHMLDQLRGYVRICIEGNSYDRFLNLCAYHEIRLWDLRPAGERYEANLSRADFFRLKAIVKKSRVRLRIVRRYGLPFFLHRYRKRRWYVIGMGAALCLMLWLSAHVWKIDIDGNLAQTDDAIFEYLAHSGIYHGMRKSGIDCKALAAQIRNQFTEFSWVAVELNGTQLQIHVREGTFFDEDSELPYPMGNTAEAPSDLTATESGTVLSLYVRRGLPLVEIGDEVEKGQILVSGTLPVYNDSAEISSYQYVAADADVVIRTQLSYCDSVHTAEQKKDYTGRERTGYLLEIGSLPFALPTSFGALSQYDVTGTVVQLKLAEHFYLPIYLKRFTAKEYEKREIHYTKEELQSILNSNLQYFMKNLEEKGVQIFENDVKIEWTENSASAVGTLTVGKPAVCRSAVSEGSTVWNPEEE